MILFSSTNKLLIIIELTVPWESRIDEAYERKKLKYSELCDDCRDKGWSVWCYPVEVGCRGFVGTSTIRALRQIGLTGKERNKAINEMSDVAEKASSWLWLRRSESRWEPSSWHVSRGVSATPRARRKEIVWWSKCRNSQRRPLHHWGRDMCSREMMLCTSLTTHIWTQSPIQSYK